MRPKGIVLASTSPYRRDLLSRLGFPFRCVSPPYEERRFDTRDDMTPAAAAAIALEHALGKAQSLGPSSRDELVIASDQVCECEGRILEKAGTEERAVRQLLYLSGKEHRLHTAVAVLRVPDGGPDGTGHGVVTTRVQMRRLTEAQIRFYVSKERPLDSAGSYYSETLGIALFERFETPDPTAIIGLPLTLVCSLLEEAGVDVLNPETWPEGGS
ncbi:MAG: Maf family protein [Candidatus Eisenbacteria bacterium]|nr:Maf family protein [Candidatus Eisenbacteria bacterium]